MSALAAAPKLHSATCILHSASWPFFPSVETSTPGEATQHLEVLSGSVSHPSHRPTMGAWVTSRTAVNVEQVT